MFPDLSELSEKLGKFLSEQTIERRLASRVEVAGWIFAVLMQQSPISPVAWTDADLEKYVELADRAAGLLTDKAGQSIEAQREALLKLFA